MARSLVRLNYSSVEKGFESKHILGNIMYNANLIVNFTSWIEK